MGIYDNIKYLCKKNGITVKQMEETLDITRSSVCRWNNNPPTLNSITKVANYFEVSIDYLVGREQRISDESIEINTEVAVNEELRDMIGKFMQLDTKKQAHVSELISLLSE